MRFTIPILILSCFSALSAEIVPLERRIEWDPGVRGGRPNRTTVYTNLPIVAASVIQTALNNCPSNQVVLLTNGTYDVTNTITIPTGVTLRGRGMDDTILQGNVSFTGITLLEFDNSFDTSWTATSYNLTNCVKDSASITTMQAHGWSVGEIVLIDVLEDPTGDPPIESTGSGGDCTWCGRDSGARPMGQWVEIQSVPTSTTATIDPPLYWDYPNSLTPEGTEMTGITRMAGVEDLTSDALLCGDSGTKDNIGLFGGVNCWMYNVKIKGNWRYAIWGYGSLWFTLDHCYVVGGVPIGDDYDAQYDSSRAYGPYLGPHFTAGLMVNNIFEKLVLATAFEGVAAGNVWAYNYSTNIWWKTTGDAPRRFGPLMHGPHPFMNLIEGNYTAARVRADEYWGTSSHFTVFKNRIIQVDRGAIDAQTWTVDIERRNHYWSFAGNIIGDGGGVQENQYELIDGESAPYQDTNDTIWKLGYEALGTGTNLYDTNVYLTMIRWDNWCYRTNDSVSGSGITYHTNNVSGSPTVPDSYYLDEKPTFFGFLDWPPYNTSEPTDNDFLNIPAGYRYLNGVDPTNRVINLISGNATISGNAVIQ